MNKPVIYKPSQDKPLTNQKRPKSILRKRRYKRPSVQRKNSGGTESPEKVKEKQHLKFAGPIKVIVIEPKSEYCKNVWCAIGIGLSNIAIGAVIISVLHYSVKTGDAHAIICCIAYHFFTAEAILALHYANGWSSAMRLRHKKFAHIFLHICGVILGIIGTLLVCLNKGITVQPHGLTGILTTALVLLNILVGPFVYVKNKKWILILHLSVGIPAFIMSSICVCFGFVLKSFKDWAGDTIVFILITLVIFYSVFIVTGAFMKCMSKM